MHRDRDGGGYNLPAGVDAGDTKCAGTGHWRSRDVAELRPYDGSRLRLALDQCLRRNVLDVGSDVPLVAEGVFHGGVAVSVRLVGRLLD